MEDEYFADNIIIYIKKIAEKFNYDSIIHEFMNMKMIDNPL